MTSMNGNIYRFRFGSSPAQVHQPSVAAPPALNHEQSGQRVPCETISNRLGPIFTTNNMIDNMGLIKK